MKNVLPKELYNTLKEIYTADELLIIEQWFSTEKRKPTFRINTLKADIEKTFENIEKSWLKVTRVSWFENAFCLEEWIEREIWNTWAYKAWYLYMQWLSSMIPPLISDLATEEISDIDEYKILDLTAAPWSKTSQFASLMNNGGKIVAIDNNQIRLDKLSYTLKKQWVTNTEVIKIDARNTKETLEKEYWTEVEEYFDTILFDAPCSAEGRMNLSREKSYAYWKEEIPKRNYKLQKQIISANIELLKTWGEFIYSTCTLSPLENEAVVHFILSNYPELQIDDISDNSCFWSLATKSWIKQSGKQIYRNDVVKSVRVLPSPLSEWFFIAKFRKKAV